MTTPFSSLSSLPPAMPSLSSIPLPGDDLSPDLSNGRPFYSVEELLFKILVIGDFGVGKTAIIRRYTEGIFSQNYKVTIGVDFAIKFFNWDDNTQVTLQLWDIAGHERFGYMTRVYYKYANAAIIVFDLSRLATLESALKWQQDVMEKVIQPSGQSIPIILLANKCDIDGTVIDCHMLNQFCKDHDFHAWFFTSAKENINIKEAIECLVEKIIIQRSEDKDAIGNGFVDHQPQSIQLHKEPPQKKNRCCSSYPKSESVSKER